MWVLKENQDPQDSRVIPGLRVSQAPRAPSVLQERRVHWGSQACQACPVPTDPRATPARKAPLERKEARARLAPRAPSATQALVE